jgi:hypothetical protein
MHFHSISDISCNPNSIAFDTSGSNYNSFCLFCLLAEITTFQLKEEFIRETSLNPIFTIQSCTLENTRVKVGHRFFLSTTTVS